MSRKYRVQVSNDEGQTWKSRWVNPLVFNPKYSELNEGELVKVNGNIHKVIISDGRMTCPPLALVVATE